MKQIVVLTSFLFITVLAVSAQKSEIYDPSGGAIHGYDPVAYFNEHKAVKGDKLYALNYKSATWYFVNSSNLETFKKNPEAYMPQYGGYCAYGLAQGHKAPTDPQAWSIVDGKLYLNYNKDIQSDWKKKQAEYINTANKNWPAIKDKN